VASNEVMSSKRARLDLREVLGRFSRLLILLIMMAAMTVASPAFLTVGNLLNILRQAALIFVCAAGQTTVILGRGIDLSQDSIASLSGVITANMLKGNVPVPVAMGAGLAAGLAVGLLNGLLVTKIKLPPFVATLSTWLAFKGVTMWYNKYRVLYGFPQAFRWFGAGVLGPIPAPVLVGILVFILVYFLHRYTTYGRRLYAVGANPEASRVSGIKNDNVLIVAYGISALAAAAGIFMYIGRINSSLSDQGTDFAMNAITAALIGGISFDGGIGSLPGVVIGAITVILLRNALNLLGVAPLWHGFFTGLVVIISVLGERFMRARGGRE
jgi:ribose/xylose/arabinose/galactoside ABC-type transport system permease subunit